MISHGGFNLHFSNDTRANIQKITKDINDVSNIVNRVDLMDINWTLHSNNRNTHSFHVPTTHSEKLVLLSHKKISVTSIK